MSVRYGHQSLIMAVLEATYGTAVTTPTAKFTGMFNYNPNAQPIPTSLKTQTIAPKVCTQQLGIELPDVTIETDYVAESIIWLEALLMDTSSPHVLPAVDDGAAHSLTLYRAFPADEDDAGDGFKGAGYRVKTMNITRDGDKIVTTVNLIGADGDEEVDLSGIVLTGITDTTAPCHTLMPYSTAAFSILDGGITDLDTFSLDIECLYNPDEQQVQNNTKRTTVRAIGFNVKFTADYTYDTAHDAIAYDNFFSTTAKTITAAFTDGAATHTYTLWGQYLPTTILPDIEQGLYKGHIEFEGRGDGTNADPISLAVS